VIFDKLCGIAERHDESLLGTLREARLFVFDGIPHEFLPKEYGPERAQWLAENLTLPFPVTATEDLASCVILIDLEEGAHGLDVRRKFVECLPVNARWEAFRERTLPVSEGTFSSSISPLNPSLYSIKGEVSKVYCAGKREVYLSTSQMIGYVHTPGVIRNAHAALQELMLLNTPDRFILEASPAELKVRKGTERKVRRSHERPTYTLLKPFEIRKTMGIQEPTGEKRQSPIPHERRAHTRVLRSERYKAAKGKTIIVPAVWVGTHEAKVGNKMYRVMLDL
jgi:hypothetical protein